MTSITPEQARMIFVQLTGDERNPTGLLKLMVGGKHFQRDEKGIVFKFSMCRKANWCQIHLNGLDYYDMTFIKCGKYTRKEVERYDNLMFDSLKPLFESFTGLTLGVPRVIGINA